MKNSRALPIPFLIVILAGVVSLFSMIADRRVRASTAQDDSAQMQTVEQERMAAIYFRILSWVSGVTAPREGFPAKADHQPAPAPRVESTPRNPARPGSIELCSFPVTQSMSSAKRQARRLN